MSDSAGLPVLWQLRFSHYNEKARWALDFKGIAHERRSFAPGAHRLRGRLKWKGRTTPILEIDGRTIGDSTRIIAALEQHRPDPPLYPTGAADRERALALEDFFDEELGPCVRGAAFDALLEDPGTAVAVGAQGFGTPTRLVQRATFPLIRPAVRRDLVDSVGGGEEARRKTVAAMDRLEGELGERDHLVGETFTVADLTAAALFTPLVAPAEFPYELPDPGPPRWVEETYRRYRGSSSATSSGSHLRPGVALRHERRDDPAGRRGARGGRRSAPGLRRRPGGPCRAAGGAGALAAALRLRGPAHDTARRGAETRRDRGRGRDRDHRRPPAAGPALLPRPL
ncbi:MAG TPA: glutathione S-transferase [Solirubrobacterales bacterium]|nr:glutathione S-transferase [Solirubrobacterales bacterium]